MRTSAVEVSIHATSPLFGTGAGVAGFTSSFAGSAAAFAASAAGLSAFAAGLSCAMVAPAKATHTITASQVNSRFIAFSLERRRIGLAGADADYLLELEHENLAVADLAGVGGFLDGLDHLLEHLGLHCRFDLHLRQEVHDVLRAPVELGVALLAPEALHLRHRDALHTDAGERLAHLVELERLDNRRN